MALSSDQSERVLNLLRANNMRPVALPTGLSSTESFSTNDVVAVAMFDNELNEAYLAVTIDFAEGKLGDETAYGLKKVIVFGPNSSNEPNNMDALMSRVFMVSKPELEFRTSTTTEAASGDQMASASMVTTEVTTSSNETDAVSSVDEVSPEERKSVPTPNEDTPPIVAVDLPSDAKIEDNDVNKSVADNSDNSVILTSNETDATPAADIIVETSNEIDTDIKNEEREVSNLTETEPVRKDDGATSSEIDAVPSVDAVQTSRTNDTDVGNKATEVSNQDEITEADLNDDGATSSDTDEEPVSEEHRKVAAADPTSADNSDSAVAHSPTPDDARIANAVIDTSNVTDNRVEDKAPEVIDHTEVRTVEPVKVDSPALVVPEATNNVRGTETVAVAAGAKSAVATEVGKKSASEKKDEAPVVRKSLNPPKVDPVRAHYKVYTNIFY
jgi:hypothetical protein